MNRWLNLYILRFVKAPNKSKEEEAALAGQKKSKVVPRDSEEAAFGTYAGQGGTMFTYRVRNQGSFGSYKIVTEASAK